MSQIKFEELTTDWVAFTDITTPENNKNYYIQNRGSDLLLVREAASKPTDGEGIIVKPYESITYQKGSETLYLRAFTTNTAVNVSMEG